MSIDYSNDEQELPNPELDALNAYLSRFDRNTYGNDISNLEITQFISLLQEVYDIQNNNTDIESIVPLDVITYLYRIYVSHFRYIRAEISSFDENDESILNDVGSIAQNVRHLCDQNIVNILIVLVYPERTEVNTFASENFREIVKRNCTSIINSCNRIMNSIR